MIAGAAKILVGARIDAENVIHYVATYLLTLHLWLLMRVYTATGVEPRLPQVHYDKLITKLCTWPQITNCCCTMGKYHGSIIQFSRCRPRSSDCQ